MSYKTDDSKVSFLFFLLRESCGPFCTFSWGKAEKFFSVSRLSSELWRHGSIVSSSALSLFFFYGMRERERYLFLVHDASLSLTLFFKTYTKRPTRKHTPLKLRVTARACDKSRAFFFCTHVLCLLLLFLLVRWESLDERVRVDFFVFFVFEESSSTESQKCTFFLRSRKEER